MSKSDKPKCGRPTRQHEGTCARPAGWGTPHPGHGPCKLHGGSLPVVVAAEARRELDRETRRILARLDVTPVDNPLIELATLAGQVVAFKNELAGLVNELEAEPVECPECGAETGLGVLRYQDAKGAEQLRSEVALFERALDRCNTVLGTMARLNIDERLATISERQAEIVLRAIDAALDSAGVPSAARPAAKRAASGHLRAVS